MARKAAEPAGRPVGASGRQSRNRPRHRIAVLTEAAGWRQAMPEIAPRLRQAAAAALGAAGPTRAAELAVVLTDDARQRALNAKWRGKDRPTNVLAFPAGMDAGDLPPDTKLPLGDVVLALETVAREAELQGKSLADHAAHLTIHGVLHLLGHDHDRPPAAARMEGLETVLLASLGIADPYRAPATNRAAAKRAAGR